MDAVSPVLRLSDKITLLPVIHGSGECALAVRRWLLDHPVDCLAVPLPRSFQAAVEAGVTNLPAPGIVIQGLAPNLGPTSWTVDEDESSDEEQSPASYVPIDPCQPVIAAIRLAQGEHWDRAFIDLETDPFIPQSAIMPDPYALKHVPLDRFATALLPGIPHPPDRQTSQRIEVMARRLRELEQRYQRIVMVCSVLQWPWLRDAFQHATPPDLDVEEDEPVDQAELYQVNPRTLIFLFGELPFVTGLYEQARAALEDDDHLTLDGVKQLLLTARDLYRTELGKRARRVTPLLLAQCIKYIRNLSLIGQRMTPDLYTIAIAAQQILGDAYARSVVEVASQYPYRPEFHDREVTLGIDQGRLPDGRTVSLVSRLPGPATVWRSLELQPKPSDEHRKRWQSRWDPYRQCSWPPEDERIELFRTRVAERAQAIIGADLARTEKFTTSVKDGIDIRDTLRHWYEGQIYVRIQPPDRGKLDACVALFDWPADPRKYVWRTTWFAEHPEESTLAFFATDFRQDMVGPGIGLASYGGALFLFPPLVIPDIWTDTRLDFVDSLEERLLAAACLHSRSPRVAILSALPPGAAWRRVARRMHKQLVHVPLSSFSDSEVQQLRMVHVLNGTHIRSYAADFIRRV